MKRFAHPIPLTSVMCLLLALGAGCGPAFRFARHKPVKYSRQVAIPDEAVIYQQNLALMRTHLELKGVKHAELVLPPRIIVESLQLRIGNKHLQEFNVRQGATTRVLIRDVDRYLQPGKPLVVEYLTWGIYWSAQYRVDVLPEGNVSVQLGALVRNHWYDLTNMKVTLVAGWVGVSKAHYRAGKASGQAGARLAGVGPRVPRAGLPPAWRRGSRVSRRRLAGRIQFKTRAFESDLVRKYRIRRVDNTGRSKQSNFQRQFASYYRGSRISKKIRRALRNRVDGYYLFRNLRVNLRRNQQSYLRIASATLAGRPDYLWPADRGEQVFTMYRLKNNSKILMPAGTAWIHRDGVFVGQDVHHWTPVGGEAVLTTSNDGGVAVKRRARVLNDDTRRLELNIRSLAKHPVRVEIFAHNPLWRGKGKLTFSHDPLTVGEKGRYHRWKVTVPAMGKLKVQMDFRPAPKKPAPPKVAPAAVAPTPNPAATRRRRR